MTRTRTRSYHTTTGLRSEGSGASLPSQLSHLQVSTLTAAGNMCATASHLSRSSAQLMVQIAYQIITKCYHRS
jgi:hypothetical protein